MPSEEVYLSVVIPAFNESGRLPVTLEAILAYLRSRDQTAEVLIVDDGSTDGTEAVAEGYRRSAVPVRVIRNEHNAGKGFSVRRGVLESRGRYVLFCDADGSTPIETLDRCWPAIRTGARVVIGSRHLSGSRLVRPQPWRRRQMSRCFRWLGNRMLYQPVSDIMCGFKLFEAQAARAIFSRLRLTQWAFDAEALFLAQHLRVPIAEVPVVWTNDERTRVRLSVDSWRSLVGVGLIRWYALRGVYGPSALETINIAPRPADSHTQAAPRVENRRARNTL